LSLKVYQQEFFSRGHQHSWIDTMIIFKLSRRIVLFMSIASPRL
jgi:hypothetical protein